MASSRPQNAIRANRFLIEKQQIAFYRAIEIELRMHPKGIDDPGLVRYSSRHSSGSGDLTRF